MKCPSCAAPLPPGKALCRYCGSTTDVDFAAKSVGSPTPPEHPRPCAACGKLMDSLNVGSEDQPFFIERCPGCLGLFFDQNELEAIIDREVPPAQVIDHLALARLAEHNGEPVRYRKCPVCRKMMNRINYGQSSGVIVDRCRDHGVYLDAGELRRIEAWVRAGGRLDAVQKAAEAATRPSREMALPLADAQDPYENADADFAFRGLGALFKWIFRHTGD
jgi:Zn-finger nucleic acid-binding protein